MYINNRDYSSYFQLLVIITENKFEITDYGNYEQSIITGYMLIADF